MDILSRAEGIHAGCKRGKKLQGPSQPNKKSQARLKRRQDDWEKMDRAKLCGTVPSSFRKPGSNKK